MSVNVRVLKYCKSIVVMETCIQQEQGAKLKLGY